MKTIEIESSENVYNGVINLAKDLAKEGKTMTTEELLGCIKNFQHPNITPYGGVRGVLKAAHNRCEKRQDYEGIECLETVFRDKNNKPLL